MTKPTTPLTPEQQLDRIRWRPITDVAELAAERYWPIKVVLACWYGGEHNHGFTIEAEYQGDAHFARLGGGPLGTDAVITHWCWPLLPPPEAEMLAVSLQQYMKAL